MGTLNDMGGGFKAVFDRFKQGKFGPPKITWAEFKEGWAWMPREEKVLWICAFLFALTMLAFIILAFFI